MATTTSKDSPTQERAPNSIDPIAALSGVKINTWGTSSAAGNGMLHVMDSQLFGGNVGHASVEVTFPADQEGERLIKLYCKDQHIPYRKTTYTLQTIDKDKKITPGKPQEFYTVYFSWWPPDKKPTTEPGQAHQYKLVENLTADTVLEGEGAELQLSEQWAAIAKLRQRKVKGALGGVFGTERIISEPDHILHTEGISSEDKPKLDNIVAIETLERDLKDLEFLIKRLAGKEDVSIRTGEIGVLKRQLGEEKNWPEWLKDQEKKPVKFKKFSDEQELGSLRAQLEKIFLNKEKELKERKEKKTQDLKADPNLSIKIERFLTLGLPPSSTISLPLAQWSKKPLNDNGLDVEGMLQRMAILANPANENAYSAVTKNCCTTVASILEDGAVNPFQQDFFRRRAFGFFGNPQEVYNMARDYADYLRQPTESGSPIITTRILNILRDIWELRPVERLGGYLLRVLLEDKASAAKKVPAAIVLFGVVAPLALAGFLIRKAVNPLQSFKDGMGVIRFAFSRSKRLGAISLVIPGIFVAAFAIPAAIQYTGKAIISPMMGLFKKKPEHEKEERKQEIQLASTIQQQAADEVVEKQIESYIEVKKEEDPTFDFNQLKPKEKIILRAQQAIIFLGSLYQHEKEKEQVPIFKKDSKILKEISLYLGMTDLSKSEQKEQKEYGKKYNDFLINISVKSKNIAKPMLFTKEPAKKLEGTPETTVSEQPTTSPKDPSHSHPKV